MPVRRGNRRLTGEAGPGANHEGSGASTRLSAVADAHPALGRDGGNECARGLGTRARGPAGDAGPGLQQLQARSARPAALRPAFTTAG